MAIRHREVFPVGSSPDSIQWDMWNDAHALDDGAGGLLVFGPIADGEFLKRDGDEIVGAAGGGGGGLAIYGDASDGDVVIDGPDYPALAGIDDWEPTTAYVVGDLVKSTGAHIRVFKCRAAGTSGGVDPFIDTVAGLSARRDVMIENNATTCVPLWEQESAVVESVVEGNIYAENLIVEVDLRCVGWILYATETLTLDAGITLSADGASATDENGANSSGRDSTGGLIAPGMLTAPVLGIGLPGAAATGQTDAATELIVVGAGGGGGNGADGNAGRPYDTTFGYRGIRALPSLLARTIPLPAASGGRFDVNKAQLTSFGGGGGANDGASLGGGGGEGGGPLALFGKTLNLSGTISSVGGDGAPGDVAGDTGGGGGAQGGAIILVYDTLDDTGATYDVSGGAGGAGQGTGTDGGPGTNGAVIAIPNA